MFYKGLGRTCKLEIPAASFTAIVAGFEIYPWLSSELIFFQMSYPMAGSGQVPMEELLSKLIAMENRHNYSENGDVVTTGHISTPLQQPAFSKRCKVGRVMETEMPSWYLSLKYYGSCTGHDQQVGRAVLFPWLLP